MSEAFVVVPGNPVPAGGQCAVFDTGDGVPLRYGLYPPAATPRGTVCLLQGRGECLERNFETVNTLCRMGFHVASMDWRGQGGSPPARTFPRCGHIRSFGEYVDDFVAFMNAIVLPDCPPPYVLLGNSMGGNIGLHIVRKYNWFEAAVMVAPFLDISNSRLPRWFKFLVIRMMCWAGLGKQRAPLQRNTPLAETEFDGNPLTHDEIRFLRNMRLWQQAPHLFTGAPTAGWVNAARQSCQQLQGLPSTTPLRCPCLMMIAGGDSVVDNEAAQIFSQRMPGAVSVVINGARHDILCESDTYRDQFFAAFEAFVDERVRAPGVQQAFERP